MAESARIDFKNDRQIKAAMKRLGDDLPKAVMRGMQLAGVHLAGETKERKLSGQVLKVQTGRLRSSITSRAVKIGGGSIIGLVGSNVVYARGHEFGVPGKVKKRPYLRPTFDENRRRVIEIFRGALLDWKKAIR